jgi:hypothetical protein
MFKRCVLAGLLSLNATKVLAADTSFCKNFLQFGGDRTNAWADLKKNIDQVAWQWFVCLTAQSSAANRAWEGCKPDDRVYLPDGNAPPSAVTTQAKTLGMDMSRGRSIAGAHQQRKSRGKHPGHADHAGSATKPSRCIGTLGEPTSQAQRPLSPLNPALTLP